MFSCLDLKKKNTGVLHIHNEISWKIAHQSNAKFMFIHRLRVILHLYGTCILTAKSHELRCGIFYLWHHIGDWGFSDYGVQSVEMRPPV
jgi:hypothetical protein